jgi:hypothetical protein
MITGDLVQKMETIRLMALDFSKDGPEDLMLDKKTETIEPVVLDFAEIDPEDRILNEKFCPASLIELNIARMASGVDNTQNPWDLCSSKI